MLYILHGDEEFTRSEAVHKLKAQVAKDGLGDLNTLLLDGRKLPLDALLNACNTLPFLSDRRLVIVENLLARFDPPERSATDKSDTPSSPSHRSAAEAEYASKLVEYLPQLPPSTRLVFIDAKILGRSNPILKRAVELGKEAYIKDFQPPDEEGLRDWIRQRAKGKGATISREAVVLLASYVGSDLRQLDQELEKLAAYADYAREINEADIKALVSAVHEADIFAMVDSLGERNRARAVQQLQALIANGANNLYLLTMIARQFRLLLAAKDLTQEQKLGPREVGKELHIAHDFIVKKLLQQAQSFSMQELEAIQRRILEIDQAIKTGLIEGDLALELLLVEVCRQKRIPLPVAPHQERNSARTR